MKKIIFSIMLMLSLVIVSCNGSGRRDHNDTDSLSIEESKKSETVVIVPRTIEGISLGMSEQELRNVINPQDYPRNLGYHDISKWDRDTKEILTYWRKIDINNKEVIVEHIKCYNGKVFEIGLDIPYGTYEEVLGKFFKNTT